MRAGAVQMGAGVPYIYIIYTLMMVPMGNPWVNLSDFLFEIFHQFRVCSGYCADGAKSSDRHKHVKIIDSLYLQKSPGNEPGLLVYDHAGNILLHIVGPF